MYQAMKHIFLLSPLLLLIRAAPATQPTDQLIVQVRHLTFAIKGVEAAVALAPDRPVPADAKELASLQTMVTAGTPFETVAILNGTTYRIAGIVKRPSAPDSPLHLKLEYLESTGEQSKSIFQFSSNLLMKLDNATATGGVMNDQSASAVFVTLKRP